jgi:hypothetical protein
VCVNRHKSVNCTLRCSHVWANSELAKKKESELRRKPLRIIYDEKWGAVAGAIVCARWMIVYLIRQRLLLLLEKKKQLVRTITLARWAQREMWRANIGWISSAHTHSVLHWRVRADTHSCRMQLSLINKWIIAHSWLRCSRPFNAIISALCVCPDYRALFTLHTLNSIQLFIISTFPSSSSYSYLCADCVPRTGCNWLESVLSKGNWTGTNSLIRN